MNPPTFSSPVLLHRAIAATALLALPMILVFTASAEDRPTKKLSARAVEKPAEPATRSVGETTEIANNESFTASTNGSRFRHGENLVITVEAKQDGYLRIWGFDDSGKTVLIFPNVWDKEDQMTAGRTIQIPSPELADDYDLFVSVPDGKPEVEEYFEIVFSPEPFNDGILEGVTERSFVSVGTMDSATRRTKGLTARAVSKSSTKTFPYVVKRN